MRPLIALILLGLMTLPAHAEAALTLRWSSGATNLNPQDAVPCTLGVHGLPTVPRRWHLAWRSDQTIGMLRPDPQARVPGYTRVCVFGAPADLSDQLSNLYSTEHCSDAAAGAPAAYYVFSCPAGVRAHFRLYSVSEDGTFTAAAEATLNGGFSGTLPCVVESTTVSLHADTVIVDASGAELEGVGTVRLVGEEAGTSTVLRLISRSFSRLEAQGLLPGNFRPSRLEFLTADGALRSVPATVGSARGEPAWKLIVRFRSGQVVAPRHQELLATAALPMSPGLRDTLQSLGVEALRRMFPDFDGGTAADSPGRHPQADPGLADVYVVHLVMGADPHSAAEALSSLPHVVYVEEDVPVRGLLSVQEYLPNDPKLPWQWGLKSGQVQVCQLETGSDARVTYAWDRTKGSPSVGIAILDSGIDTMHLELDGHARLLPTPSFGGAGAGMDSTSDRHGTAVAGIAAAIGENAEGIAGVAYQCVPYGVKVARRDRVFTTATVVDGINTAVANRIPIINLSLKFPGASRTLADACRNAARLGHFVVAGSGNDNDALPGYPAAYSQSVWAVGASDWGGQRWDQTLYLCGAQGSSYGWWLDFLAPGGDLIVAPWYGPAAYHDVTGCDPAGLCNYAFGGTSASAPFAAGVAALLKSYRDVLTGDDIGNILRRTTQYLGLDKPNYQYGWGIIDAAAALNYVTPNRGFLHLSLGASGAAGPLRAELATRRNVTFRNADALGVADGTYDCDVYRMGGTANYGVTLLATPRIWSRSSGAGWDSVSAFDYDTLTSCAAVVGTPGLAAATLKTFVYHVRNAQGAFFAWVPVDTTSARIDFTVAGVFPWNVIAVAEEPPASLLATSPNPVAATARITYSVATRGPVRVGIWDVMGREISVLADGPATPGLHEAIWNLRTKDGARCPAGVVLRALAGRRHNPHAEDRRARSLSPKGCMATPRPQRAGGRAITIGVQACQRGGPGPRSPTPGYLGGRTCERRPRVICGVIRPAASSTCPRTRDPLRVCPSRPVGLLAAAAHSALLACGS